MVSLYSSGNYRELIRLAVRMRKAVDPRFTLEQLAKSAGIQKSYLSKVMNGRADFQSDQLFLIGDFFGWTEGEAEFALLLLEYERSSLTPRKKKMLKQIDSIRDAHLAVESSVEAPALESEAAALQDYYLNPWVQIIHICLSVPRFAKDLELISTELKIDKLLVNEAVQILLKRKIIAGDSKRGFEVLIDQIHLPKKSPVFRAWQTQLRSMALHRLQSAPQKSDYCFNVLFSGDEGARRMLQNAILELLERAEATVKDAPSKELYYMSFDLFRWN